MGQGQRPNVSSSFRVDQSRYTQFLDASKHLYMRVYPSVSPSVGPSVRPSVGWSVGGIRVFFKLRKLSETS